MLKSRKPGLFVDNRFFGFQVLHYCSIESILTLSSDISKTLPNIKVQVFMFWAHSRVSEAFNHFSLDRAKHFDAWMHPKRQNLDFSFSIDFFTFQSNIVVLGSKMRLSSTNETKAKSPGFHYLIIPSRFRSLEVRNYLSHNMYRCIDIVKMSKPGLFIFFQNFPDFQHFWANLAWFLRDLQTFPKPGLSVLIVGMLIKH